MTVRAADAEKEDDYTTGVCLEHAGDALTAFTQNAVGGRLALVQAMWLHSTVSDARCQCGARAAFRLVHVYDDAPRYTPDAVYGDDLWRHAHPGPFTATPADCVATYDKRHRFVCVGCGASPSGPHGL